MAENEDSRAPALADRLRDRIMRDGPITFHDWMEAALYDERDGYYRRADRIRQGRAGDYRTAPETSPLFGATFANYFAQCYTSLGSPGNWTIFEMGAGRGDFAHAVLTTLRTSFPDAFAATRYLIGELGDEARNAAAQKLSNYSDRVEFHPLEQLTPPFSGIIFSNELLDAFPVHRVIGSDGGLRELCVDVNETNEFAWRHCDLEARVAEYCERIDLRLNEGQIYEVNPGAEDFVAQAARLIDCGFLISVDYGSDRADLLNAPHRHAGTLRSFQRHRMTDDVLSHPGEQDLTTTVDWTQIQEAGARSNLETTRFERLDKFLLSEGLLESLSSLNGQGLDTAGAVSLQLSAREMIRPDGLAASFQVLIQQKRR
jgi:SAM-dependent MidA family methyltransferase